MPKILIQISAFFKNDKPGGIGVTLTEAIGDLNTILSTIQKSYNMMWEEAQQEGQLPSLIHDLRVQLAAIAVSSTELCISHATLAIGNVYLLESRGQLVADEYNGIQLAYIDR